MFKSSGSLKYYPDEYRMILSVNQNMLDYYFTLIPRYYRATKPGWKAHITAVRPEKESPPKIRYWGDYENEEVEFLYDSYMLEGGGFYWINVWSKRLETIREELGLENTSKYSLRPTGYNKTFHITIGKYQGNIQSEPPEK